MLLVYISSIPFLDNYNKCKTIYLYVYLKNKQTPNSESLCVFSEITTGDLSVQQRLRQVSLINIWGYIVTSCVSSLSNESHFAGYISVP